MAPRSAVRVRRAEQARSRTRTDDPLLTMEVLYQLSYPGGRPHDSGGASVSGQALRRSRRQRPRPRPSTSSSVVSHEHIRRIVAGGLVPDVEGERRRERVAQALDRLAGQGDEDAVRLRPGRRARRRRCLEMASARRAAIALACEALRAPQVAARAGRRTATARKRILEASCIDCLRMKRKSSRELGAQEDDRVAEQEAVLGPAEGERRPRRRRWSAREAADRAPRRRWRGGRRRRAGTSRARGRGRRGRRSPPACRRCRARWTA